MVRGLVRRFTASPRCAGARAGAVALATVALVTAFGAAPATAVDDGCVPSVIQGDGVSGAIVIAGPVPAPVFRGGPTGAAVDVGDCSGWTLSGDAGQQQAHTGGWSCKRRPWWSPSYYYCSGSFQHNKQSCYVEWYENYDRVDGSPWDDSGDEIDYIKCATN